jgi:hypothetical protein
MKARTASTVFVAAVAALLGACSNLPADDSDRVVALTGVVTARRDTDGVKGSSGSYAATQGGAVGYLVAGLIVGTKTTGPFHVYTIRRNDGSERDVAAYYEVADGTCVDVAVPSDRGYFDSHWKPSEVVLRQSTGCSADAAK